MEQVMRSIRDIFCDAAVLDADGRHVNGSDKESNHHYGDTYEDILGTLRTRATIMMEIGVADGSSLLAWREVFPYAKCVGLDIHHSDKACRAAEQNPDWFEFHLGDAASRDDCERAAAGRQFDFICEDATHRLGDTLMTLLYLWPHVKPGGMYVVEEFHDVLGLRRNIAELWPFAEVVDTVGPSGGTEPLVVFRKPKP